jgi:predicted Zn-dependent protease
VADAKHIAAWHGWAILEIKQGNIKKARNLLGKALKYCGGNEYIYQTLALLEAKAERFEQARTLFQQATQSNPKSCASWLVSICFIIIFFLRKSAELPFLPNCAFMYDNFLVGVGSG